MTAITKRMCISEPAAGNKVKPSNHKTNITTAIVHNICLTPFRKFALIMSILCHTFIYLTYGEQRSRPLQVFLTAQKSKRFHLFPKELSLTFVDYVLLQV